MTPSQQRRNSSDILQMQLMHERLRVGEDALRANERLLELESVVCQCLIDPATAHRTVGDQAYAHLTYHYGNYVDAYTAQYGHRPLILSFGDDDGHFAIGAELAGCRVRMDNHTMAGPTIRADISLDRPSAWFTEPVAGVHAYGDVDFHIAAAVTNMCEHAPPSIQVDVDSAVRATNFDVHRPDIDARTDATVMRENATCMAHRVKYATCTEHSVLAGHSAATHPGIAHSQLLAGQMVAAFMHEQHGMPLWTRAEVAADATKQMCLQNWAHSGYSTHGDVSDTDAAWVEMVQGVELLSTTPRVLQRDTPRTPPKTQLTGYALEATEEQLRVRRSHYDLRKQQISDSVDKALARDGAGAFFQIPQPGEPLSSRAAQSRNSIQATVSALALVPEPSVGSSNSDSTAAIACDPRIAPISRDEQDDDPALGAIRDLLSRGESNSASEAKRIRTARNHFVVGTNGLLCQRATILDKKLENYERLRVVVPWKRRRGIMEAFHTSPVHGHRGYQSLYEQLSARYYWAGMYTDCVDFVEGCEVCAVRKPFHARYGGALRARQTPARPFHEIALDIKGPLLTTDDNNQYILVVVCLLTRFVVAIPLPNVEGKSIARALVDHVFCVHGCSYRMQVDGAGYFKGEVMTKLSELFGIKRVQVLPYQPTANGSAEAVVKKVANQLQRHGNAMRAWDRYLQLVVHGINCTAVNAFGMTPFYTLFGRDPVGLAELEWPDLQRLDVDGSTFVSELATNIRKLWSDIKSDSDEYKRLAVERANRERKTEPRPVKPGDFVFVEYGDDDHSKRMGKAGLPGRRRFKVLEYWPERGYVKIDTDGHTRLQDKVSLHRVSRAPAEYTVKDLSTPIRSLEKHANSLSLPPGWRALQQRSATGNRVTYAGPGGRGVADSASQAWAEYNNDPVYMPQPRVVELPTVPDSAKAAQVPLLPAPGSALAKAPVRTLASSTSTAGATSGSNAPPPNTESDVLTTRQAKEVLHALEALYQERDEAVRTVHGWKLKYVKRNGLHHKRHGDWHAWSPSGENIRSKTQLMLKLGLSESEHSATSAPAKTSEQEANDGSAESDLSPAVGSRIGIWWPGDAAHFYGRVIAIKRHEGVLHHKIHYDDEATMWHDLRQETWKYDTNNPGTSAQLAFVAATVHHKALAKFRRQEAVTTRCDQERERHNEMMMGMVWECEFGTVY